MFPPLPPNETLALSHIPPAMSTSRSAIPKKIRK